MPILGRSPLPETGHSPDALHHLCKLFDPPSTRFGFVCDGYYELAARYSLLLWVMTHLRSRTCGKIQQRKSLQIFRLGLPHRTNPSLQAGAIGEPCQLVTVVYVRIESYRDTKLFFSNFESKFSVISLVVLVQPMII